MQIANVKQRQILPRVGKIWACTPQNLASGEKYRLKSFAEHVNHTVRWVER